MATISPQSDLAGEISFETSVQPSFIMIIFCSVLYGVYTVLYGLHVYLQVQQRGRLRYYQISLSLLYVLSTAAIVIAILAEKQYNLFILALVANDDVNGPTISGYIGSVETLNVASTAIYVIANFTADTVLLYRCYIVWSPNKSVIVGTVVLSLVNILMAVVYITLETEDASHLLSSASVNEEAVPISISLFFLGLNFSTNLILTGLIAGRIWWISHSTSRYLSGNDERINGMIAMFLESGLIYPLTLLICIILVVVRIPLRVQPLLTLIVGIVPTLIMVRADLGIGIESTFDTESNVPPIPSSSLESDETGPTYMRPTYLGLKLGPRKGQV